MGYNIRIKIKKGTENIGELTNRLVQLISDLTGQQPTVNLEDNYHKKQEETLKSSEISMNLHNKRA